MAASHTLGPGTLTFGEHGSEQEFGGSVTTCTLTPEFDQGDNTPVLSGDTIAGELTETWTLGGEFLQSYDSESLLLWCKINSGKELPFVFKPRADQPLTASGIVTIRATPIGGDVKTRTTSGFEFVCVGVPDVNADGGEV